MFTSFVSNVCELLIRLDERARDVKNYENYPDFLRNVQEKSQKDSSGFFLNISKNIWVILKKN